MTVLPVTKKEEGKCVECGREINDDNFSYFGKVKIGKIKFHVCEYCLLQALSEKNIRHIRRKFF